MNAIINFGITSWLFGIITYVLFAWLPQIPLKPLLMPVIISTLRRSSRGIKDIEAAIEFAYSFYPIKPHQNRKEIRALLKIISEIRPKIVVEIGTAEGGTLFLFARAAEPTATIISVDLPTSKYGRVSNIWRTCLFSSFAISEQKIHFIEADSHDHMTLHKLQEILGKGRVDFLFLDGDHSYVGVKKDFEMYSPLVRKGGIVVFHDIVDHPARLGVEVGRFWSQVKDQNRSLEIVDKRQQGWAGIGVLYL